MVRPLQAAGHLLYLPSELGVGGQKDEPHLNTATSLGAVLVTTNQRDFEPLHRQWQASEQEHAGILLTEELPIGELIHRLQRAAQLLTQEIAHNQLMHLALFRTDELAEAYATSLTADVP